MNIDSLLKIEKDGEVLKFHFEYKNTLIWPYIRFYVLRKINERLNTRESFQSKKLNTKINWKDWIFNNPYSIKKRNILIIGVSKELGNIDKKGRYFNSFTVYYEKMFPKDTLVIEDTGSRNSRYLYNKIYSSDIINATANHISNKYKASIKDTVEINKLIEYLKKIIPEEMPKKFYSDLKSNLIYISSHLSGYYIAYSLLIKKIKPSVVMIRCATYGGLINATIIRICKEMNIPTAEIQHGTIEGNFEPTNYSDIVRKSKEYKKYLPDYYLLYGDYWKQYIKADVNPVIIGNPLFTNAFKRKKEIRQKNDIILWISTGEHKQCKYLLEQFFELQNKFKVCLKLHPLEDMEAVKKLYRELEKCKNFKIVQEGNIYSYLKRCKNVVVSGSTVVYEAKEMGNRVLVAENGAARIYTPSKMGEWFKDEKDLLQLLKKEAEEDNQKEQYYCIEWEENYKNFINKFL